MKQKLTDEQIIQIRKMRQEGCQPVEVIKRIRKEGTLLKQIAIKFGVHPATISKICIGKARNKKTQRGASSVEYAMLITVIAAVAILGIQFIGPTVRNWLWSFLNQWPVIP